MSYPTQAEVADAYEKVKHLPEFAGITMEEMANCLRQARLLAVFDVVKTIPGFEGMTIEKLASDMKQADLLAAKKERQTITPDIYG